MSTELETPITCSENSLLNHHSNQVDESSAIQNNIDVKTYNGVPQASNVSLFENYLYHFDDPQDCHNGWLSIYDKLLVFALPSISSYSSKISSDNYFQLNCKNIQLFINKQLRVNTQWLPVVTQQDWYKLTDMFYRGYQAYLTQTKVQEKYSVHYPVYSERKLELVSDAAVIQCTENVLNTVIHMNIENPLSPLAENNSAIHIQIYIDNNLLVCTKSLLPNATSETIHTIVAFLLSMLIKW